MSKLDLTCETCGDSYTKRTSAHKKSLKKAGKCLCGSCSKSGPKQKHDKVTIFCDRCNTPFVVKYSERHRTYCSKSCASASSQRPLSCKKEAKCIVCKKTFMHYGNRVTCSKKCMGTYLSQQRLGENNPAYKPKCCEKCKYCGSEFEFNRSGMHKGTNKQYCSKQCWDAIQKGKNKSLDGPAVFSDPYPAKFKSAKIAVRKRDNKTCCLCNETRRDISVHHIDYDKFNSDLDNLICLCRRCHGLTNFNRMFWQTMFNAVQSGCKVVKKGWGAEVHIVNHHLYCLKYLIFFKDRKFSYHFHERKQECWHCLVGGFDLRLRRLDGEEEQLAFKCGNVIELLPTEVHQLTAQQNSVIVEVSTQSFNEDSIRIEVGD